MKPSKSFVVVAACLLLFHAGFARAQTPVRMLSGFPPGAQGDALARLLSEKLAEALGRPVVVDIRAGAAGAVAAAALKAAAPDGNTLMLMPDSSITLYPHTLKTPAYDPLKDFAPIAHAGSYDLALAVGAKVPAKDLREWIGWAKSDPNNASFGASGVGLQLLGFMVGQNTGVPLLNVSYRGSAPAVTDLLGGQIPAVVVSLGTLTQLARTGKVRVLAHTGGQRSPAAPEVPTFKELGYPALEFFSGWYGIMAPAGIRPEMAARYNAILVQAQRTPGVRDRMRTLALEVREMAPAEIAAMIKARYDRWGSIVKASGYSADNR